MQLACVNWYGASQPQMVMNGLNAQPLDTIAATIVKQGFNCVRVPFSLELVLGNRTRVPDAGVSLAANPALHRLSPLEVFDKTVEALTDHGLLVFLNDHLSASGWCCSNTDGEGLWYTDEYPEAEWLRGLALMTARYRHNVRVVGMELRNEVRPFVSKIPSWGTKESPLMLCRSPGHRIGLHAPHNQLLHILGSAQLCSTIALVTMAHLACVLQMLAVFIHRGGMG